MPNPALDAYLARNYLDGPKAEAYLARSEARAAADSSVDDSATREKKRRKKRKNDDHRRAEAASSSAAFRVVDDEDEDWKRSGEQNDDEDDEEQVQEEGVKDQHRHGRWNKVGKYESQRDEEDLPLVAKDAPQALHEHRQAHRAEAADLSDVGATASASSSTNKSKPIRAGLKTREEMRAERLAREQHEAEERRKQEAEDTTTTAKDKTRAREEEATQTVYRDASGRRIDVAKEDADRLRSEEAERQRQRERREWTRGEKQIEQAREERKRQEDERHTTFARHASDKRMNETLRNVQRANDPAAAFLTAKEESNDGKQRTRPTYKGAFPPNRFGIRPGYRWDGVERGNGFEAKLFLRRNERTRRKAEEQAWRQEDM